MIIDQATVADSLKAIIIWLSSTRPSLACSLKLALALKIISNGRKARTVGILYSCSSFSTRLEGIALDIVQHRSLGRQDVNTTALLNKGSI